MQNDYYRHTNATAATYRNGFRAPRGAVLTAIISAVLLIGLMAPSEAHAYQRNSSETNPTPTEEVTRTKRPNSRDRDTRSSRSEIHEVEWEYQGDGMFDIFNLSIIEANSQAEEIMADLDPEQMAFEVGMTYLGEDKTAPDECRMFQFGGPMGISIFIGICVDDGYAMTVMTTDYELNRDAMDSFVDGEMPEVPRGYYPVRGN